MNPNDQELISEIQKLNLQLKRLNSRRGLIARNFTAGLFHSLGSFFGTAALFALIVFFASQLNITENIANTFEQFMSQIRWEKIIPTPTNNR